MNRHRERLQFRDIVLFLIGVAVSFDEIELLSNLTISYILSALYLVLLLPYFGHLLWVLVQYRKALAPLAAFVVLLTAMNVLNSYKSDVSVVPMSIILNICLSLLIMLHAETSFNKERTLSIVLVGIMVGCFLTVLLYTMGIGVEIHAGEQVTMFNQNVNKFGLILTVGLLVLLDKVVLNDGVKSAVLRIVFMVPFVLGVFLVLDTGSRVSFLSLIVGLFVLIFRPSRNNYIKLLFLIAGAVGVFWLFQHLDEFAIYDRLMRTIEGNDTSGRSDIWKMVLPQAMEHPVFGVGQTGYAIIRTPRHPGYSPHNVLIEVFAYTGIVGLVIMLLFWTRLVTLSFNIKQQQKDILPLLFCVPIIGMLLSGQLLADKVVYIIYAVVFVKHRCDSVRLKNKDYE